MSGRYNSKSLQDSLHTLFSFSSIKWSTEISVTQTVDRNRSKKKFTPCCTTLLGNGRRRAPASGEIIVARYFSHPVVSSHLAPQRGGPAIEIAGRHGHSIARSAALAHLLSFFPFPNQPNFDAR
jgi:hypothetical protein